MPNSLVLNQHDLAKLIDHTLLKADATHSDIITLVSEAKQYGFKSVCINPFWVKTASDALNGTDIEICTVIGFPLGATSSQTKAFETTTAIMDGATEIDMVLNIGALKSGDDERVKSDITAVVDAVRSCETNQKNAQKNAQKIIVKVILETCLLTDDEKVRACHLCVEAGADFVKTSTGFSTGGATVADIQLMRKSVGPELGVKASGGIRSLNDVMQMTKAGATRVGASASIAIVTGLQDKSAGY